MDTRISHRNLKNSENMSKISTKNDFTIHTFFKPTSHPAPFFLINKLGCFIKKL